MKLHYYPETDSLYIELSEEPGVETREVSDGVNVDIDAHGKLVGFDIDRASRPSPFRSRAWIAVVRTSDNGVDSIERQLSGGVSPDTSPPERTPQ